MMHTTRTEATCCYCGKEFTHSSDIEGEKAPTPGDISICISCAGVLIFTESMQVRKPTEAEMREANNIPAVRQFRRAVLGFRDPKKN